MKNSVYVNKIGKSVFDKSLHKSSGGPYVPPPSGPANLATAPANSDTVDIWLAGAGSTVITWRTGSTTNVTLTSVPTKYSFTYAAQTADISMTESGSITSIVTNFTNNFTITTANINSFANIANFINVGGIVSGTLQTINRSSLNLLNLGDQQEALALTGDIGLFLNNKLLDTFYVRGGDFSYTNQSFTGLPSGFSYRMEDTNLSDAEIDLLVDDIDAANTGNYAGTLSVTGEINGHRTSASNTSFSNLGTDGVTLEFNGIVLNGLSFSNSGQAWENGVAATTMAPSVTDEDTNAVSTDIEYEAFNLPSFLTLNSSTGQITANGTPTTGYYNFMIRVLGFDTYTGIVNYTFQIIVDDGLSPVASLPTVTGVTDTQADIGFTVNESHQTAYYVVTQSSTAPSAAQVRDAQDHLGGTPDVSANQTITASGVQTFPTITTLVNSVTYYAYMVAADVNGNLSNVVTTGSFTTQTPQAREFLVNIYGGTAAKVADELNDPSGRYWNNLDYNVGSVSNIVETDNTASTISVAITGTTGGGDYNGDNADSSGYPAEAWDSERSVTTTVMEISITGLDAGKTYDITIGASRPTGNREGRYLANGDIVTDDTGKLVLDASTIPPPTGTISGVSPGSGSAAAGEIYIEAARNITNHTAHFNWIHIVESV